MRRVLLAATLATIGCSPSVSGVRLTPPTDIERAAPLGPGYVLLPLGTDDDALLGEILLKEPGPGQAFEEVVAPNPCAASMDAPSTVGLIGAVEDAQELKAGAAGRAALGVYGFSGEAKYATHFVYKLATTKRESRSLPPAFLACCRDNGGCGYGVISELVYGAGDYSAAEETSGSGSVDVVHVATASGSASLKVLHKRHVQGWIAAKVTQLPPDPLKAARPVTEKPLGPVGAASVLLDENSASAQVKELYDRDKLKICPYQGSWAICDGRENINEIVFADRYSALVDAKDVDFLQGRRNWGWFAFDLGLIAAGVGIMAYGFHAETEDVSPTTNDTAGYLPPLLIGGAVLGTGLCILLVAHAENNPYVDNHHMTQSDADQLIDRYNRALLRKVTADVEKSRWDTGDAKPDGSRPSAFAGPSSRGGPVQVSPGGLSIRF